MQGVVPFSIRMKQLEGAMVYCVPTPAVNGSAVRQGQWSRRDICTCVWQRALDFAAARHYPLSLP